MYSTRKEIERASYWYVENRIMHYVTADIWTYIREAARVAVADQIVPVREGAYRKIRGNL